MAFGKIKKLQLVPEQQSVLDSGIRLHQFALDCGQPSQAFNEWSKRLISLIATLRQSSMLLLAHADKVSTSTFNLKEVLTGAAAGSVLDPVDRDTYNLVPRLYMLGALNPNHSSPLFPEPELVCLCS